MRERIIKRMPHRTLPETDKPSSATQALIKRLRERWGMSQSEIARVTGIPQPRLSRWEAGEVATGADDALKLQALVAEKEATDSHPKAE